MLLISLHCSSATANTGGESPSRPRTFRLKSFKSDDWHTISLDQKTCDCAEFKHASRCPHLDILGIHRLKPFTPSTHPTFSQALSGLVKSLRIRRVEDAIYWLLYLNGFKEPQYRFRTARRILIGSAEDGHSVAIMEKVAENFKRLCKPQCELPELVMEAVRICKLPNWWHPASGGPDYIYSNLVGQRMWLYKQWDRKLSTLQGEIEKAIGEGNRVMAAGGLIAFADLEQKVGATKQAEYLLQLAERMGHDLAGRLCRVHLSAKSALSGDNNFLGQAVWMMAGGVSPIAESIEAVTAEECHDLLDKAKERWRNPQPPPLWNFDGIHCSGSDSRFAGLLPEMWAVCRAFQYYKRVRPEDEWLPSFRDCSDGLMIQAI
jgi:hypothetical protein